MPQASLRLRRVWLKKPLHEFFVDTDHLGAVASGAGACGMVVWNRLESPRIFAGRPGSEVLLELTYWADLRVIHPETALVVGKRLGVLQ